MSTTIGVIGVGRVGLPVCSNLVRAGQVVVATDCRSERKAEVLAAGAVWKPDDQSVARAADVLVTVLPGSPELRAAMADALPALRPSAVWIDMTSTSPLVAGELVERALVRGVECLDSPVGGGIDAAEKGTLQLFVGGPVELVERHRRLLEALGNINHMGAHGAGYTTKLIVNLLWFSQAIASGEALLLARRSGIDLEVLRGALGASAARSEFILRDLGALLDGDYLRTFGLDRCCEELDAVQTLAHQLEVPSELSSVVARAYTPRPRPLRPRRRRVARGRAARGTDRAGAAAPISALRQSRGNCILAPLGTDQIRPRPRTVQGIGRDRETPPHISGSIHYRVAESEHEYALRGPLDGGSGGPGAVSLETAQPARRLRSCSLPCSPPLRL
jgi:3-hydroxyisobutyrate dehydrogenase